MNSKQLLYVVVLLLSIPMLTVAQANNSTAEAELRQTLQYYIDGWKNLDADSLKKAYHPKARLFSQSKKTNSGVAEITGQHFSEYLERYGRRKTEETFLPKIVSIDITGDAASAKVEFSHPNSWLYNGRGAPPATPTGVIETRYLTLIKVNNGWAIVSEISTVREGR